MSFDKTHALPTFSATLSLFAISRAGSAWFFSLTLLFSRSLTTSIGKWRSYVNFDRKDSASFAFRVRDVQDQLPAPLQESRPVSKLLNSAILSDPEKKPLGSV